MLDNLLLSRQFLSFLHFELVNCRSSLAKKFFSTFVDGLSLLVLVFELFLLLPFTIAHFLELFLDLDSVLSSSNDASLRDLLAILVVEDHPHRVLEVLELLGVDALDLVVLDLAFLH